MHSATTGRIQSRCIGRQGVEDEGRIGLKLLGGMTFVNVAAAHAWG